MQHFFEQINIALKEGRNFVLVSIISSTGSTPRGDGAKMAVFENGQTLGTIGGGAVEYVSTKAALEGFSKRASWSRVFSLTPGDKAELGMVCGGRVEVCFLYIDAGNERFGRMIGRILAAYKENLDTWLVTKLVDKAAEDMGIYDPIHGLQFLKERPKLPDGWEERLFKRVPVLLEGNPSWFGEPLTRSGYTYIFGGGHVAQALVPVISNLEFKTIVYEDRKEFCNAKLFPGVHKVIYGEFLKISEEITLTGRDFVIIMTRGHQCDYEVLTQILKCPVAYIGVIGSRNKIARTKERLLDDGFSLKDIERVHWPIGLPVKAKTPAEIAISIAAELILCRANLWEA
ncbi:MAG: XdhC family protein [Clostridiales bacterium]|nr:XdhC family protein [Clostridiales bacterium]